jgi:membrane-associated protein
MTPFCAGVGAMPYFKFLTYSLCGGIGWVLIGVGAGYFFGNMEVVQKNFSLVILGVVIVSLIPIGVEAYLHSRRSKKPAP